LENERGSRWWRLAAATLVGALFLAGPIAGSRAAEQLFNESFVYPTVTLPGLTVGHSGGGHPFQQVCLTASTNSSQTPIPGCSSGQAAIPAGGDPSGAGALRLTDNEGSVAGFVLYNVPLPLTGGLDVHFDLYSYDTTTAGLGPADGVSFFLVDGSTNLTKPGAAGGSLGYAQQTRVDGVAGGYLGVGLDEWGNFTNDGEGRGAGCPTGSAYAGGVLHKNWVGVRGPGDGTNGYCLLKAVAVNGDSLAHPRPRSSRRTRAARRRGLDRIVGCA